MMTNYEADAIRAALERAESDMLAAKERVQSAIEQARTWHDCRTVANLCELFTKEFDKLGSQALSKADTV